MTAKILQLVNSSFFGLPARINDPGHAAKMLGADVLKGLILTALTATYAANTLIGQEELDLLYLEQVGLGDHVADWQGLQKTGTNIHGAL